VAVGPTLVSLPLARRPSEEALDLKSRREIKGMVKDPQKFLEQAIYERILGFSKRIDQMETRSEEACKRLAQKIVALVERHRADPSLPHG
jgi:hypothetical protein